MDAPTNEPVNIGNPTELTIESLARTILKMTGSASRIVHQPLPEDDPKVRKPDITRARDILGWEPKVGLEEGLTKTAVGGMALSVVGMLLASAGYLPPVSGAIAQELIDVFAVLNALRTSVRPRALTDY